MNHKFSNLANASDGITLVLGSGGARGFSFIGVLKALDEAGIPIARIIGASMGSILGAAYSLGTSPAQLEEIARHARPGFIPLPSFFGPGVLTPRNVRKLVEKFVPAGSGFKDLSIPLSVICTDYHTGLPVELTAGDLHSAVLGSSIAGAVFDPVEREGQLLIDGGYSAPVPVQYAANDAVVLAVSAMVDPSADQSGRMGATFSNCIPGWMLTGQMIRMFDIQGFNLYTSQVSTGSHILVEPQLGALKFTEFKKHAFAIESGYQAMQTHLVEVESALERFCG